VRYHVCGSFSFALTAWYFSLRVTRRTRKKGQTPASRHASAAPQRATSPVQKPLAHAALLEQEPEVQPETKPLTPSAAAATGTPQLPDRQTPPPEHDPLPHESPPAASADASDVAPEPYERLVERVHEVVPDVLPAHVFDLLATHDTGVNNRDSLLNLVIHILLEDRSYPKDIKGKGKARAAAEETSGDTNTSVDYTHPPDRRLGRAYQNLSLVRINFPLSS
jgi:E3 ubiquitin-protein ligase RNF216